MEFNQNLYKLYKSYYLLYVWLFYNGWVKQQKKNCDLSIKTSGKTLILVNLFVRLMCYSRDADEWSGNNMIFWAINRYKNFPKKKLSSNLPKNIWDTQPKLNKIKIMDSH